MYKRGAGPGTAGMTATAPHASSFMGSSHGHGDEAEEMEHDEVAQKPVDKTRAIVVEIKRTKSKGPIARNLKMKIKFDDPNVSTYTISGRLSVRHACIL